MSKKIFIFDFDGTIADTHEYIVRISNQLADEFNYKKMSASDAKRLKEKSSQEIIRHLRVPVMKIPSIIAKAKKELHKNISTVKPFDGLVEILKQLKSTGIEIGILSSNSAENIKKFLKNHNIDMFDFIHTTSKVWSKNTSIHKLMKKYNFSINQMLYIGDEIRDVVAAKKIGVCVAAVTWGYNSGEALRNLHPDFLIHKPEELLGLIA